MATAILLVALGVILIVLDIVFIPGMIIGIFGGIIIIAGIVTAYISVGPQFGHIMFIAAVVCGALLLGYAVKTDVWSRFALKDTISSKVNEELPASVKPGDLGITVSALRPSGKVEINGEVREVFTLGNYCEAGKTVKVSHIQNGKIFVEPENC